MVNVVKSGLEIEECRNEKTPKGKHEISVEIGSDSYA
jgi:hypothetical protein